MKTISAVVLFAALVGNRAGGEHEQARRWMAEAQKTSNPFRLFALALDIHKALDAALARAPDDVQVRLDLVRFHTMAPRIAGGDIEEARAQAAEIARRDAPLGHFARGYIAYREKEYGTARRELSAAAASAKDPETRKLALRWFGWLSQETEQWEDAFAAFGELRDAAEITRTEAFCGCRHADLRRPGDAPTPSAGRRPAP